MSSVIDKAPVEKAERLRREIFEKVAEYYQTVHAPQKEFRPGESRVPYAGRVFDADEMINLVDSSLDFWLTAGRYAEAFEAKFAQTIGVNFSLLTNSGSSANLLAFSALTSPKLKDRRIRKGDEVITVAAGFPTTVAPAVQFGAVPVFLDVNVDDGTYNVDVSMLEAARTERTRAVMIAHTLGNPFDLRAVKEFCERHHLWLVEDNCDALGSRYDGKLTGTFGDVATSSFYPPHHLTMGEGGAVYTNSPLLKKLAESFRDWGRDCYCASGKDNTCNKRFNWRLGTLPRGYDHKYTYSHFGYNLKVTDMQAAVGMAQLEKLPRFTAARRRNWQLLRDGLADMADCFVLPEPTPNSEPSWFGFLLTVRPESGLSRNKIVQELEDQGIQTRMLFAGNLTRHPCFDEMRESGAGYRVVGDLTNTDRIMNDAFWVGVYPGMTDAMLEYMLQAIRKAAGK
jgi:CDP-6-deoxy-D-xylo-4-hexulose-3-dehydrase